MVSVNTDKIKEYKSELEKFDGYLPYLVLIHLDYKEYYKNLQEYDDKDTVDRRYYEFRLEHKRTSDEQSLFLKDLRAWCKQYPMYEDIIDG